jgi:hypothetical protein
MPYNLVPALFLVPAERSEEQAEQRNINVPGVPQSVPIKFVKNCICPTGQIAIAPHSTEKPLVTSGAFHSQVKKLDSETTIYQEF